MTLRLPVRLQTRWGYAAVSGISGAVFALTTYQVFPGEADVSGLAFFALLGSIAAPAAALCWPWGARSLERMVTAGVLSVLLALALAGFAGSLWEVVAAQGAEVARRELIQLPFAVVLTAVFGSTMTLGIPYLVAMALSALFVDDAA